MLVLHVIVTIIQKSTPSQNQAGATWKAVAFTIIVMSMAKMDVRAKSPIYNVTGIYMCQGKTSDFDSRKCPWQVLKVTNATVWTGKEVY